MRKKIGIIGGLSPESTASYYLHITRSYVARFGTDSYPEIIIYSVDLDRYHRWRELGRWDLITEDMIAIADTLLLAGADIGLIATNTMHKVFDRVQAGTTLPLLHILDATVNAIRLAGLHKVGVLGTRFTMAEAFYTDHLAARGIAPLVPGPEDQAIVHDIIVNELVRGKFSEASRQRYLAIIERLERLGAEGIVLACTEIPLLIQQEQCSLPLFDTATLHAEAALNAALTPACD
ncbi:aspartate/glutamate racemase family protein [Paludibacterium yongneupense]|uniref:aspartate/glutamate racemase family protein n=1 Tax=Paludibacterium yongneupense TaxID=400061 RepID=UPI00042418B2|nr:amino acid racemase [Paludibacterium yongneupense]